MPASPLISRNRTQEHQQIELASATETFCSQNLLGGSKLFRHPFYLFFPRICASYSGFIKYLSLLIHMVAILDLIHPSFFVRSAYFFPFLSNTCTCINRQFFIETESINFSVSLIFLLFIHVPVITNFKERLSSSQ